MLVIPAAFSEFFLSFDTKLRCNRTENLRMRQQIGVASALARSMRIVRPQLEFDLSLTSLFKRSNSLWRRGRPSPRFRWRQRSRKSVSLKTAGIRVHPEKVSLAYTIDSQWRNRAEFPTGRAQIVAFLSRKWTRELDYRLIKELWAFRENRIAVRFAYEYHDDSGNWYRAYGNRELGIR